MLCQKLNKTLHFVATFDSEEPSLNDYLKTLASQHADKDISSTFVLPAETGSEIRGFYTLSLAMLVGEQLSEATRRAHKLPKHELPAILLGRLAVDRRHQGRGWGGILLMDAMLRASRIADAAGAVALLTDSLNDGAAEFYRHYGFEALPSQPTRLILPMKVVRQRLETEGF